MIRTKINNVLRLLKIRENGGNDVEFFNIIKKIKKILYYLIRSASVRIRLKIS